MSSYFVGDGNGQSDGEWGSTGGLHKGFMGALWSPCANIAIILIIYAYRKYWVWLHMAFFTFATIITLASSFPILAFTGMIPANSTQNYDDYSASVLRTHYILGIVACGCVGAVSLIGGLTKLLNICNASTNVILWTRRIHTWSGYAAVICCKVNIYILGEDAGGWIAIDVISLLIYIIWCYICWPKFFKLEGRYISPKYEIAIPGIKSLKELDQSKGYVVFANNVYDIQPLRYNHPAGYQIVQVLKNKEVDRYIYGSCVADQLPQVPIWSHSFRSFTLMDEPVARLDIMPTFDGFDGPEVECQVPKVHMLSQKGCIYQINLQKKTGKPFIFLRYRDVTQIGRYFGITLNEKVTRLYTTVNFLVEENTKFMEKHCKGYFAWIEEYSRRTVAMAEDRQILTPNKTKLSQNALNSEPTEKHTITKNPGGEYEMKNYPPGSQIADNAQAIPIMFKTYGGGKFTQGIVKGPIEKIVISHSKGEGLQLAITKPGKIILVAGGTGIYPFSDFIDLLYKEQLMKDNPGLRGQILTLSPVLESDPFKNFNFEMLAAFQHIEDMHPITLDQLTYLADKGRLKLTMKFRQNPQGKIKEGPSLSFTKENFQNILEERMTKGEISRVWICGPPGMNIMVSKFLRETYKDPDLYLIV